VKDLNLTIGPSCPSPAWSRAPDARESTNRVKKSVIKELFSDIGVFAVKKGSYTPFTQ